MSAAAFKATYSEWKVIKTRQVVQVVFEVPTEHSDLAYQVLGGMPISAQERWFAVARLDKNAVDDAPSSTSRETGAKSDLVGSTLAPVSRLPSPYAREAGMLCNDTDFQDFLEVEYPHEWSILNTGTRAEKAAVIVRKECGVKSRADIRSGPSADAWRLLYESYLFRLDDRQQEQQRREYEESVGC